MDNKPNQLIIFSDGASRGNPGLAGYGYVIYTHFPSGAEKILKKCGNFLGTTTNNQAEYHGLIYALSWLISHSYTSLPLAIYLDSLLVVNQIKGKYKVKKPHLLPLFQKTISLLNHFPSYTITHIPRSQNVLADELANLAIDSLSRVGD